MVVEHELLKRRQDPKDRRANGLFLTERGRQLVDDLDSLRDAIATDLLHDIADEKFRTSLDTLRDIKDRIKGVGEHSGHIVASSPPIAASDADPVRRSRN